MRGQIWNVRRIGHTRRAFQKMLVLSRKKNEQIVIGENIVITIVDVRADKVRIGIEAPAHIPVHRHEVYLALQQPETPTPGAPEVLDEG